MASRIRSAASAVLESLQPRRLMAVTSELAGGILTVDGTNQTDFISVKIFPQTPTKVSVVVSNHTAAEYDRAAVTGVVINGHDGDDRIDIDEYDYAFTLPATLNGGAGRDFMGGGSGDDSLDGGTGRDYVNGEAGNDTVIGGASKDLLYGNAGDDLILAGNGNDRVYAGAGNDTVIGGRGDDSILGSTGNDSLYGSLGTDLIQGEGGTDTVIGGRGDDRLDGGAGVDEMSGGAGADSFAADPSHPHETADRNPNDGAYTPTANDDFVELITTAITEEFPHTNIESVDADEAAEVMRVRYTYTTADMPGTYDMLILNPGNDFSNPDLTWYEINPKAATPEFQAAFPTLRPGATALSITKCDMNDASGVHNGRGYKVEYQIATTGEVGQLLASEDGHEFGPGTVAAV